jgi:hypothetical protein
MHEARHHECRARAATRAVVVALMAVAWLAPATPARAALSISAVLPVTAAPRPPAVAPVVRQPSAVADRNVTASRRGRQLVNDRKSIRAEVGKGRTPAKRR